MRIAFVNATRKWGGDKNWCLDMGRELSTQGHEVWIVGRRGVFLDKAARLGLRVRAARFGFDFNPAAILSLSSFFWKQHVDVVVVNGARDLRTAGVAARLLGRRVLQRIGGGGDLEDYVLVRLMNMFVKPVLLCCSGYVRERIAIYVPSVRDREAVILPSGVRVDGPPVFAAHDPRVIVLTSSLTADNRYEMTFEALTRLMRDGVPFRVLVAGRGRQEEDLRRLACDLGLASRVEWLAGELPSAEALPRGDIFVLPSVDRPQSLKLEWAMAAGLAPVAHASGGVPDVWPEACGAFLVGGGDWVSGLERALRTLLLMPGDELTRLRRAAWTCAREDLALPVVAARFARIAGGARASSGVRD